MLDYCIIVYIQINNWSYAFRFAKIYILKFPYNAHSDGLKQRALSENKARVDDGKLAFEFVIRNFDPN